MELLIIAVVLLGQRQTKRRSTNRAWLENSSNMGSIMGIKTKYRNRTTQNSHRKCKNHSSCTSTEYQNTKVDEIPTHQPEPDSSDYESFEGHNAIGQPYTCYDLKASLDETIRANKQSRFRKDEFTFRNNRKIIADELQQLIKIESPIHFDFAVHRILSTWALRKNQLVTYAINQALLQLIREGKATGEGKFIWKPGKNAIAIRCPVAGIEESERKLEYIYPEEIEQAIIQVVQNARWNKH